MNHNPVLAAELREENTKQSTKALRANAQVPAVLYGFGAPTPLSIALNVREFVKVLSQAGSSSVITVEVGGKKHQALIQDVQRIGHSNQVVHVDFLAVNPKVKVTTEVPVHFVGVAEAIETLGGTLVTMHDHVEVEALPSDLPHGLEVDLAKLATFDDNLLVSDIVVPAGITILTDADTVLASVTEPRSEEEMEALDAEIDTTITTEFETKDAKEEAPAEEA
jgi:large subunit ribosomal protein L25